MVYRPVKSNLCCETIARLQKAYNLRYFVETGTFRGDTAQRAASFFAKVWTVEVEPKLFMEAKWRLADWPNVECFLGQSPAFLRETVKWTDDPILFWLDAHWAGSDTGRTESECPLLAELDALGGLAGRHVVLVDDVAMFSGPVPLEHCAADWPAMAQIEETIGRWPTPTHRQVADNILELTPW